MSGRTHSQRFRLHRDSVPKARRHVQATLTRWMLAAVADDAELIISELSANAVQHARGIGEFFEVGLRRRNGVLVLEVSDSYQWQMPKKREADPEDIGGRGLVIVDALSDNWGVRPRESGKTVWAHLAISGREAASPAGLAVTQWPFDEA
ncbi:ATP-binding protein [Streptomyces caniscabiei]|uniref:ATP-binding protein n=1 Tax=Streptomyces TaxID=1883 RepID=UPI0029B3179B|nr:ATP-binding protein [Streptomyces caniscabiei]MDX2599633.1 ATP-binding protein [Streptomyces caniscabiei]MDX2735072.1 ATP-binding protein [Streptomyces caniscabiei]MDX2783136.1 ATP-binding protein [Streptomyces caniscabiei]